MTIPDEAIQAAIRGYSSSNSHLFEGQITDALTAALPFLQGVKEEPAAWSIIFSDHYGVNCETTFKTKQAAEEYLSACTGGRVVPLYLDPSPRAQALEEALRNLLHAACGETGFANAVRQVSGLPWTWPSLDIAEAAAIRALSSQPVADGWLPIETAPKDGRVLAVATGKIERISWSDPAAVVTVKAYDGPFVCHVHENGSGFTDEFGEVYRADGIVIDAEDLTAADNVLRITHWHSMPALPSADGALSAKSQHINSGAYRRLSKAEWIELGGDSNPKCDWHEGIGYVIYDDQAHQEYLKKTNALPASPGASE